MTLLPAIRAQLDAEQRIVAEARETGDRDAEVLALRRIDELTARHTQARREAMAALRFPGGTVQPNASWLTNDPTRSTHGAAGWEFDEEEPTQPNATAGEMLDGDEPIDSARGLW
jgi:hypothetical protein